MARDRSDAGVFRNLNGAQDVVVKQGVGALVAVNVNTAGTTVSIYDNLAGTGNPIAVIGAVTGSFQYNCKFNTGLHVVTVGTVDCTITYV